MTINIFDEDTYLELDNSYGDWTNRLTVFFEDGDAQIDQIYSAYQESISRAEFEGEACSVVLPGLLSKAHMFAIANTLRAPLDALADTYATLSDEGKQDAVADVYDILSEIAYNSYDI